jgi:hypothetical protein
MAESEVITIRVPKGTKAAMRKMHINWSDSLRGHIEDRVHAAKLLDLLKDLQKHSKRIRVTGDSTKIIRHYRDVR